MKRIIAAMVVCSLLAHPVFAVSRKKVAYVGGTIESLNRYKKEFEGELDLTSEKMLVLKVKDQTVEVPYGQVTSLEYQNSTEFRVGRASAVSGLAILTLFNPITALFFIPALLTARQVGKKKRKRHYLTVIYKDAEDKPQAMVLELDKNIQQETRAVVTARSGKEIKVIMEEPDGD